MRRVIATRVVPRAVSARLGLVPSNAAALTVPLLVNYRSQSSGFGSSGGAGAGMPPPPGRQNAEESEVQVERRLGYSEEDAFGETDPLAAVGRSIRTETSSETSSSTGARKSSEKSTEEPVTDTADRGKKAVAQSIERRRKRKKHTYDQILGDVLHDALKMRDQGEKPDSDFIYKRAQERMYEEEYGTKPPSAKDHAAQFTPFPPDFHLHRLLTLYDQAAYRNDPDVLNLNVLWQACLNEFNEQRHRVVTPEDTAGLRKLQEDAAAALESAAALNFVPEWFEKGPIASSKEAKRARIGALPSTDSRNGMHRYVVLPPDPWPQRAITATNPVWTVARTQEDKQLFNGKCLTVFSRQLYAPSCVRMRSDPATDGVTSCVFPHIRLAGTPEELAPHVDALSGEFLDAMDEFAHWEEAFVDFIRAVPVSQRRTLPYLHEFHRHHVHRIIRAEKRYIWHRNVAIERFRLPVAFLRRSEEWIDRIRSFYGEAHRSLSSANYDPLKMKKSTLAKYMRMTPEQLAEWKEEQKRYRYELLSALPQ